MTIYFIQADKDGPVKIGLARTNAKARFSSIQSSNHVPLKMLAAIDGDLVAEKKMHNRFANLRVRGEWYAPGKELMEFIATLPPPPSVARRKTGRWGRLSEDQIAKVTAIWFDDEIATDVLAGKTAGISYQVLKGNLGPSKRDFRPPSNHMAKIQKSSVKSRLDDGRMDERRAKAMWHDDRFKIPDFEEATGWPRATAYVKWGARFKLKTRN